MKKDTADDRDALPVDLSRAQHRRPGVGSSRRGGFRGVGPDGGGSGYAATADTHYLEDGAGGALITETGALISDGS